MQEIKLIIYILFFLFGCNIRNNKENERVNLNKYSKLEFSHFGINYMLNDSFYNTSNKLKLKPLNSLNLDYKLYVGQMDSMVKYNFFFLTRKEILRAYVVDIPVDNPIECIYIKDSCYDSSYINDIFIINLDTIEDIGIIYKRLILINRGLESDDNEFLQYYLGCNLSE
jgi:hypothetical protein